MDTTAERHIISLSFSISFVPKYAMFILKILPKKNQQKLCNKLLAKMFHVHNVN